MEKEAINLKENRGSMSRVGGEKETGNCCNYIIIRKEKNLKELAL